MPKCVCSVDRHVLLFPLLGCCLGLCQLGSQMGIYASVVFQRHLIPEPAGSYWIVNTDSDKFLVLLSSYSFPPEFALPSFEQVINSCLCLAVVSFQCSSSKYSATAVHGLCARYSKQPRKPVYVQSIVQVVPHDLSSSMCTNPIYVFHLAKNWVFRQKQSTIPLVYRSWQLTPTSDQQHFNCLKSHCYSPMSCKQQMLQQKKRY